MSREDTDDRFALMLQRSDPETAQRLLQNAQQALQHRWQQYKQLSQMSFS